MKKQPTGGKVSVDDTSGKPLISKIYRQLMQFNNNNNKNPIKIGRGLEQAVFQRRNTDIQQECAKMLNITNHWENANISNNEISPYTCENDYPQRDNKQKVPVRMQRKGNSGTVTGM